MVLHGAAKWMWWQGTGSGSKVVVGNASRQKAPRVRGNKVIPTWWHQLQEDDDESNARLSISSTSGVATMRQHGDGPPASRKHRRSFGRKGDEQQHSKAARPDFPSRQSSRSVKAPPDCTDSNRCRMTTFNIIIHWALNI